MALTTAVAELMSNWQLVMNNLRMAAGAVQKYTEKDYEYEESEEAQEMPLPEQLVRVKLGDS